MKPIIFKELKNNSEKFFKIVPQEWQEEITPFWDSLKSDAKIYILENRTKIIGGGIVFHKLPPNFDYFETEANSLFAKGYLYLGFIWIEENFRNQNLGSFWLNHLKAQDLSQKYFLLTEEDHLQHFYEKNDFLRLKTVRNQDQEEWLYITKSNINDQIQT